MCVPHHVSTKINAEDGDGSKRKRNVDQNEEQEGSDLRNVAGQGVCDGLLQVIKDQTTCEETSTSMIPTSKSQSTSFNSSKNMN